MPLEDQASWIGAMDYRLNVFNLNYTRSILVHHSESLENHVSTPLA